MGRGGSAQEERFENAPVRPAKRPGGRTVARGVSAAAGQRAPPRAGGGRVAGRAGFPVRLFMVTATLRPKILKCITKLKRT